MKSPHRLALALFSSVLIVWIVIMLLVMRASVLPPEATGTMLVVFSPGISSGDAFSAITRAGARPIRETAIGFIWVVSGDAGKLMQQGAIGAYRDLPIPAEIAGCVAVVDQRLARIGI